MDSGTTGSVSALAVYDNTLYGAGGFGSFLAQWSGERWIPLDPGPNGSVRALTVFDGRLVAAGTFRAVAGNTDACIVAAWDGSTWSAFGSGLDYTAAPTAVTSYGDKLVVGGNLWLKDQPAETRAAEWNGNSWVPLEDEMGGTIWALTEYEGKLIAGGAFTISRDPSENCLAAWDGFSWSSLGSGVNGNVYTFYPSDDGLIVGGTFTRSGSKVAALMARWTKKCCVGRVGDANGVDGDEPTIGDISVMIDAKFISYSCDNLIPCAAEADINQSGGANPTCDDITIGDISSLIDYLFITGPQNLMLKDCL